MLAPPGCDAFYVLSPVPNLAGGQDWAALAEPYRRRDRGASRSHGAAGPVGRDRHLEGDDAAGLRRRFPELPRLRLRARAGADADRRGSGRTTRRRTCATCSSSAPAPIPAPACPASCPRPASSIRWFPMRASSPEFLAALRPASSHASEADHAACRAAIRTGSRSFYAASHLLPPAVRRAAYGLYAFCRAIGRPGRRGGGGCRIRCRSSARRTPRAHPCGPPGRSSGRPRARGPRGRPRGSAGASGGADRRTSPGMRRAAATRP